MDRHPLVGRLAAGAFMALAVVGCTAGTASAPASVASPSVPPAQTSVATSSPSAVPAITASPAAAATPATGGAESWHRVDGGVLAYSLSLPPGSRLMTSVPKDGGQDPYEQWAVANPDGSTAFGLMIGRSSEPMPDSTLPPGDRVTTVTTADGVPVAVGEASGINIFATALHEDRAWMLLAESGEIVGDQARRDLLLQIISTFRFARTEASEDGRWAPTGGDFEMQFPALPSQNIHQQVSAGIGYDLVTATHRAEDAILWGGWAALPSALPDAAFREEAARMAEGFSGSIEREGATTVAGHPGYEFVIISDEPCVGESGGCRIVERLAVVERRLVMQAVVTADVPGTSPLAEPFLDSLRIEP